MNNYKYKYFKYKKKYIEYKNNKVGGGNKKKEKKKINIDDLITKEKQLEYYKKKNPNFKSNYFKQLENILDLKIVFKDVKSNEQIKTVIKYSKMYDTNLYSRLRILLTKQINNWVFHKLINVNLEKKTDDEIYKFIHELKRKYPKIKPKFKKGLFDRKNERYAHWINGFLTEWKYDNKLLKNKKWLDFGCGDGNKTIGIQKYAKLPEKNIYTADIYEWFNYKGDRKLPFNFIPIKKNKPLPIKKNEFNIVSVIMVLHHVKNIDNLLSEMNRIIKMGGALYLIEHDAFTDGDKMLVDIEHALYETENKNFKKEYYCRCFNFIEREIIFEKYGFKRQYHGLVHEDIIPTSYTATRAVNELWIKIKNI
jgi:ubiquinone/menaquinone biosynthesis C-methylase UbiE